MIDLKEMDKYYSLEAEGGLLGSMIVDPSIIGPLSERFSGRDLYRIEHQQIYDGVVECWRSNDGRMDLILLRDFLKSRGRLADVGGVDYLVQVAQSVANSANWENYARIVVDYARLRNAYSAVRGALRELQSTGPITERLDRSEALLVNRQAVASSFDDGADIELSPMESIAPVQTSWLWPNVIPMGMITLLVGQPGQGKSFVCMDIAARVSTGRPWPESPQTPTTPGSTLIFSFEEDLARSIRPRLDACGADCKKVFAFRSIRTPGGLSETIDISSHLPQLERAVTTIPDLRMIVFDPITSCLGGADQNSQAEVRNALTALQSFAQRTGVAVVGISHFAKRTDTNAMYRILGSVSFAAVSRSIWCVHREPITPDQPCPRRLFLPVKNNYAIDPTGLSFDIVGGAIEWGLLPVTDDTDEILAKRRDKPASKKLHDAKQFLREQLEGKEPMESEEIFRRARGYEISDNRLREAKKELSVDAFKSGFSGKWMWSWPGQGMLDKICL
ncbi:MAG: AAA family ATPase [Phycisphaerae bacterium]|nr:AAA family ATPase [Phycisphaerae bacterium]